MNKLRDRHPASYRDGAGFLFYHDGQLYRQVNQEYQLHYDYLMSSGCYQALTEKQLLLSHLEVDLPFQDDAGCKILKPAIVPFISYPYEWCFAMLRTAALVTLRVAKIALQNGMLLKDASAYNVQRFNGRMIFIDSLSFEKYDGHSPWVAYRQFCEQFLGPLLLGHYHKTDFHKLMLAWPEGIPVELTHRLLPFKSRLSLPVNLHIHLHARVASRSRNTQQEKELRNFGSQKLMQLFNSLEQLIKKLRIPKGNTVWSHYYEETSTRDAYLEEKKQIVRNIVGDIPAKGLALDLGANEGEFSKILLEEGYQVIASDADTGVVDHLYRQPELKQLLPLIVDLSCPTPATGVNNRERNSFLERCNADIVVALALMHHLMIGKRMLLDDMCELFAQAGNSLLLEYIPPDDPKVRELFAHWVNPPAYCSEEELLSALTRSFDLQYKGPIGTSGRIIFYLIKKEIADK